MSVGGGCAQRRVERACASFPGSMSESKAEQVEIGEVDGQTLRTLVDYIYTAQIQVTEDNVQVGADGCSAADAQADL